MLKKSKKKKRNETWTLSNEEKRAFLKAIEALGSNRAPINEKKFDFIEEKSFCIRKRKATYRESGEKIEATLDLHGLVHDESIVRLEAFCEQCAHQNTRTVMIITGKGIHSPHGKSLLKEYVIHWLNSDQGRHLVEFYRPGSRQEGGKGVMIFYLYRLFV
ncbi:MAG: Smr/MutS family protein [bacterium]